MADVSTFTTSMIYFQMDSALLARYPFLQEVSRGLQFFSDNCRSSEGKGGGRKPKEIPVKRKEEIIPSLVPVMMPAPSNIKAFPELESDTTFSFSRLTPEGLRNANMSFVEIVLMSALLALTLA